MAPPPGLSEMGQLRKQFNELCSMVGKGSKGAGGKFGPGKGLVESYGGFNGSCYNCGERGHRAAQCPKPRGTLGGNFGKGGQGGRFADPNRKFPQIPKLPPGVQPRVCRFGMRCNRPGCTYIHVKTKSGRPLNSIGIQGDEPMSMFDPATLSFVAEQNVYEIDDSDTAPQGNVSGLAAEQFFSEDNEINADPLGLCAIERRSSDCQSDSSSEGTPSEKRERGEMRRVRWGPNLGKSVVPSSLPSKATFKFGNWPTGSGDAKSKSTSLTPTAGVPQIFWGLAKASE